MCSVITSYSIKKATCLFSSVMIGGRGGGACSVMVDESRSVSLKVTAEEKTTTM